MKCEEVQPLLIEFLDDKLDTVTEDEIENHLTTCNKCSDEIKELHSLFQKIGNVKAEIPSPALRENFKSMLRAEINNQAAIIGLDQAPGKRRAFLEWFSPFWKVAAAVMILIVGVVTGARIRIGAESSSTTQISDLQKEVKEMKEVLMFNLLDDESASQRIKAVNYAEEIPNPNPKVINALVNTLNTDKNVNVRLAAVYSLAKFSDNQTVRDSLVASLSKQTEPIIQVVLINTLTEKKETKAIQAIKEIISNDKTLKEVKDIAQKSIKII